MCLDVLGVPYAAVKVLRALESEVDSDSDHEFTFSSGQLGVFLLLASFV